MIAAAEEPAALFDVSPMPLTAPVHTIPKCTTYVPTMLAKKLVVQKVSELGHTGYGLWETTSEYLQGYTDGLNYRLSPLLAHTHPKVNGHHALIPWGERFNATLVEGRSEDTIGWRFWEPNPFLQAMRHLIQG